MKINNILEEIENYKELLDLSIELFGCNSDITINISQRLDILIDKYNAIFLDQVKVKSQNT